MYIICCMRTEGQFRRRVRALLPDAPVSLRSQTIGLLPNAGSMKFCKDKAPGGPALKTGVSRHDSLRQVVVPGCVGLMAWPSILTG